MVDSESIEALAAELEACGNVLTALGDANRRQMVIEMMRMGECTGVRVGDITERTSLSRPAVSHHLQILKDAGIVRVRREGTMNFYYFDRGMEPLARLARALDHAVEVAGSIPEADRKEEQRWTPWS